MQLRFHRQQGIEAQLATVAIAGITSDNALTNLRKVVDGCLSTIEELDRLIDDAAPRDSDSKVRQYVRAFRQARKRNHIEDVQKSLESYKSTFALQISYTVLILTQTSQNAISRSVSLLHIPEHGGGYFVYLDLRSLDLWLVGLCTIKRTIQEELDTLLADRSPDSFEIPVVDLFGRNEIRVNALLSHLRSLSDYLQLYLGTWITAGRATEESSLWIPRTKPQK
jgi:hypothetical protein